MTLKSGIGTMFLACKFIAAHAARKRFQVETPCCILPGEVL